jgi:hypothetical protein
VSIYPSLPFVPKQVLNIAKSELLMARIDPKTADIVDTGEFEDTALSEEMTPLPRDFNVSWKEGDILRTEVCVTFSLGD